jgi:hypothetical protein
MKLLTPAFLLWFAWTLPGMAQTEPSSTPSKATFKKEAKEVADMEKQLALAIEKRDTAVLEKVLAKEYFDVYEGDKTAMSRAQAIARCKAGLLKYLAIKKDSEMGPKDGVFAVEGMAKLVPNRPDDTVPAEQWVHVRRLWKKTDGQWLLTGQIRRLEGDDGKGEAD